MGRVNIYLSDDLARRAREAGINVSGVAQAALEDALRVVDLRSWLDELSARPRHPGPPISHEQVLDAIDESRRVAGRAADKYLDPEGYRAEIDRAQTDRLGNGV